MGIRIEKTTSVKPDKIDPPADSSAVILDEQNQPISYESPGVTKVRSGLIGGTNEGIPTDSGELMRRIQNQ